MTQDTAAAERSAHVTRGPAAEDAACHVCGKPITGSGFAARVLPPLVQACSQACAADPRFALPRPRR